MITVLVIVLFVQKIQAQTVQNDTIYGKQLLDQVDKLTESKKYEESNTTALEAAAIFQKAKKWNLIYLAYNKIFFNAYKTKDFDSSIDVIENGLAQIPEIELYVIARMHYLLGFMENARDNIWDALAHYEQSLANFKKINDLLWINRILGNISIIYMKQSDYWKAQEYASLGVSYAEKAQDTSAVWKNTKLLGQAYFYAGEYEKAKKTYKKAQQIKDDNDGTFELLEAEILYQTSDYEAAENLTEKANQLANDYTESVYRSRTNMFEATKLLGNIYLRQNQPEKALQQFENCLQLIAPWQEDYEKGELYMLIGDAHGDLKSYDAALEKYQTALQLFIPDFKSTDPTENPTKDLIDPESWLMEIFLNKGISYIDKFRKSKDPNWLYEATKNCELALDISEMKRLEFTETTSKLDFGAYVNEFYEVLLELKLALFAHTNEEKYLHEAFQVSQRANAFVLRELLNAEQALQAADIPKATIVKFKRYEKDIAIFNRKVKDFIELFEDSKGTAQDSINLVSSQEKLFQTKDDFEKLKMSIAKKYPKFDKLRNDLDGISVAALQKHLNENTLFIKYFLGEKKLYTFSITKESFHIDQLPLPNDFKETVTDYRKSLSDIEFIDDTYEIAEAQYLKTATTLYNQLLKTPLERTEHTGIYELTIIPDGVLYTIPFQALRMQPSKSWTTLDHAVIKKYAISYHYFCKMIEKTHPKVDKELNFASFGVSMDKYTLDYMQSLIADSLNGNELALRSSLSKLTFSDDEASQLAERMQGKAWLHGKATKKNFLQQAKNAKSIHLATHSLLNIENPNTSALIFNKAEDTISNLLHLDEIYYQDFNAEMITLSACNTGFGKYEKGEGLQSLARAFNFANIPSVTATLWSIPDASSAKIMKLYYTYLQEGHSKHIALQKAQIAYVEDDDISSPASRLPFYWSAWTHIGDHSVIKFEQKSTSTSYILMVFMSVCLLGIIIAFKKVR